MDVFEIIRSLLPQNWVEECSPNFTPSSENPNLELPVNNQAACYVAQGVEALDRGVGGSLGIFSSYTYRLFTGESYPYNVDYSQYLNRLIITRFLRAIVDFRENYQRTHSSFSLLQYRRALAEYVCDWVTCRADGFHLRQSIAANEQRVPSLQELFWSPEGECFEYVKVFRFFYRLAGFQADYVTVDVPAVNIRLAEAGHAGVRVQLDETHFAFVDQVGFDQYFQRSHILSDREALTEDILQHYQHTLEPEERLRLLNRAVALNPHNPMHYLWRAEFRIECIRERGVSSALVQEVLIDLERARQLGVSESKYFYAAGLLHSQISLHQEESLREASLRRAYQFFQRAFLEDPQDILIQVRLLDATRWSRGIEESFQLADSIIQSFPHESAWQRMIRIREIVFFLIGLADQCIRERNLNRARIILLKVHELLLSRQRTREFLLHFTGDHSSSVLSSEESEALELWGYYAGRQIFLFMTQRNRRQAQQLLEEVLPYLQHPRANPEYLAYIRRIMDAN